MEKTELFVCRCHDVCHQLVLETLETEEDEERVVYGSFHLDPLSFGDRLKNATKYILGRKRKYGDFNTLLLRPEDADRLEWFACYLDRGVAAANHAMPSHFTFHSKEYVYDLAYETSQHTLLDGSVLIDHDTWLSASMKPGNVFYRLCRATKYLCGYRSCYGDFDSFEFLPADAAKLHRMVRGLRAW